MNSFSLNSRVVTRTATLVAAVLLGLSGARAVNLWLQGNSAPPQEKSSNISLHEKKNYSKRTDYRRLVNLHLLGKVEKKAKQTASKKEIIDAPETNLNLKLIGVLFNRENKDGYAIISESGKQQKTFHKGDKVTGNTTLYAVEPNRVILKRNGRHETLTLIKPELHNKRPSSHTRKLPVTTTGPQIRSSNNENQPTLIEPAKAFPVDGRPI